MEAQIVRDTKPFVHDTHFEYLQVHYKELMETDFGREVDWGYVLQKLYLHACLKGQARVAEWFQSLFGQLGPIEQIAYRQSFPYGRHLLRQAQARAKQR